MATCFPRITRRGVIAGAGALTVARPSHAADAWTREAYQTAMNASGRPVSLTDAQFDAIQKRKPAALKRIEDYLKERLGSADPAVMAAFQAVPREYFHYIYSEHRATPGDAYESDPKPWGLWPYILLLLLGVAVAESVVASGYLRPAVQERVGLKKEAA